MTFLLELWQKLKKRRGDAYIFVWKSKTLWYWNLYKYLYKFIQLYGIEILYKI